MGLQGLEFRVFRLLGFQSLGFGVYRVKVFDSGFMGFGLQTSQGPGFCRIESLGFGCIGFWGSLSSYLVFASRFPVSSVG